MIPEIEFTTLLGNTYPILLAISLVMISLFSLIDLIARNK